MSAQVVESPSWSRRKWSTYIGLILLLHLGLIFWLARGGSRSSIRTEEGSGILFVSSSVADLSGLTDPTLLPLPNQHGASWDAWLKTPSMQYSPAPWTGPSGMLTARSEKLGEGLISLVRTNLSQPLEVASRPEPGLERTAYYVQPEMASTQSLFHVDGELAGRELVTQFRLRSWPMADAVLTNSEVQIVVDETGRVFAPPILVSKSGSDEADASALDLARNARFKSLRPPGPRPPGAATRPLAWGKLVFEWRTVPMPATNAPGTGRRP